MIRFSVNINILLFIAACMSLYAVHWIFPKILHIAKKKSIVDDPNARKIQKAPVPVLGGLAVFFGMVMGTLAFYAFSGFDLGLMMPVFLGASIMLYVGSVDDIIELTPKARAIIEAVTMLGLIFGSGMCIDSLHGLWGIYQVSWWIAVPFTVFAGVGLINAYNMVDGVNGLSSGLCMSACVILSVIFWKRFDYSNCALALCYGVSLLPFLMHNVFGRRSRMFIGDGGTMVMGFIVAWFVIRVLSSTNYEIITGKTGFFDSDLNLGIVAMMTAVAAVPVFDTLRVMLGRICRGRNPFLPDRTHLHHKFLYVGTSPSITSLSEVLMNLTVVAVWYLAYRSGLSVDWQFYAVVITALVLVWGIYFFLRYQEKHQTAFLIRLMAFTRKTHFGKKKWWMWLQNWLDRGAYEDYFLILQDKLNKKREELTLEESEEATVVNYLHGKNIVLVENILAGTGLAAMRVQVTLMKLEKDGLVEIVKLQPNGGAAAVRLIITALK